MCICLLLEEVIPSLSAKNVADKKLEQVERDERNKTVKPDDTGPTPPNSFYPCKSPVRINSYDSSNL